MGNSFMTKDEVTISNLRKGIELCPKTVTEQFLNNNWSILREDKKCMDNLSHNFKWYEIPESFLRSGDPWNWKSLSRNVKMGGASWSTQQPILSLDFIRKCPNLDYDWNEITRRNDLTEEFLAQFSDKPLDWNYLSYLYFNLGVDFSTYNKLELSDSFVHANIDKPWNWQVLSRNASASLLERLIDHPSAKWEWTSISWNEKLSVAFIKKHADKLIITSNIESILKKAKEQQDKKNKIQKMLEEIEIPFETNPSAPCAAELNQEGK